MWTIRMCWVWSGRYLGHIESCTLRNEIYSRVEAGLPQMERMIEITRSETCQEALVSEYANFHPTGAVYITQGHRWQKQTFLQDHRSLDCLCVWEIVIPFRTTMMKFGWLSRRRDHHILITRNNHGVPVHDSPALRPTSNRVLSEAEKSSKLTTAPSLDIIAVH